MRVALPGLKDRNGGLSRITGPERRLLDWIVTGLAAVTMAYAHSVWAQGLLSKQDQECWYRHPGYVEYVKCLASVMEPIDPKRREEFGEVYGAKEYLHCALTRPPGDTYCERHRLKRRPEPEYWPHGAKPNLKLPEPPRQSVYRKGMMPKEYFDALCKSEAGEFIYKTVENVEGIYQIRPRLRANDYQLRDRYVMEDPYGYSGTDHSKLQENLVQPPFGGYQFLETPKQNASISSGYVRFYRGDPVPGKTTQYMVRREDGNYSGAVVPYVVWEMDVSELRSRYGFTWRGIKRPHDRENSIAGGEFIVVDLMSNELLGFRRGFAMTRPKGSVHGPNWEVSAECPPNILASGNNKFLHRVLKPLPADQGADHAKK